MVDYTALDDVLIAKVKDLFSKLYKKGQKVRLLGVKFSHLVPMSFQMNLFDKSVEKLHLFKAVDDIKDQFGPGAVMKATGVRPGKKKGEV
jgi:DNA polymerase-4